MREAPHTGDGLFEGEVIEVVQVRFLVEEAIVGWRCCGHASNAFGVMASAAPGGVVLCCVGAVLKWHLFCPLA